MSVNSKMTAIASRIRTLLGLSNTMGLDAMATNLGTAQAEVDEQAALIAQISSVLNSKAGGIIPTGSKTITTNGTHDVTSVANAIVNVLSLPSGISKLNAGEYTSSSNQSGTLRLNHGLDETPNFYLFYIDSSAASSGTNKTILKMAIKEPCSGKAAIVMYSYFNSEGTLTTQTGTSTSAASYFNSTQILVDGSQSPAKAGDKYYWIAGVIAGLS